MFAHAIISTSRPIALSTISVGSRYVWAPPGDLPERHDSQPLRGIGRAADRATSAAQSASICAAAFASVVPGRR